MREGSRISGGVVGIAAASAGLVASELSTHLAENLNNPVISIGNRVIDFVPNFLKEFIIQIFGVKDKTFLLFSIALTIAILSIFIGHFFSLGRTTQGKFLISAMVAVGAIASLFDAKSGPFSILPSLVAGGVMLAILNISVTRKEEGQASGNIYTRREALSFAGAVGVVAVAGVGLNQLLKQKVTASVERLKIALPKALKPLPAPPSDPALGLPGLSTFFTPNSEFYRIDTALSVPQISLGTWTLRIDGFVSQPLTYTYEQLLARPTFEIDDTIACVSNEVGGNLVGNARWMGIRLDDLIHESAPLSRADQVMGHSVDGFTAGFPLAALDGRDAMIAFGMNGEVLPYDHGFPARIIVPGLYGYVSATKWLSRIELTRFDEKRGYWIPRGWAAQAPIKTSSRIDTPKNGSRIVQGKNVIAGVAWAPTRGISKVEVSIDRGTWQETKLGPVLANTTWRQWWIKWNASPGEHELRVRATDGEGDRQSDIRVAPQPDGAEGWHTIFITAE